MFISKINAKRYNKFFNNSLSINLSLPLENFKNKISLSSENIIVTKYPSYLKLKFNTVENLKAKTFLFSKQSNK